MASQAAQAAQVSGTPTLDATEASALRVAFSSATALGELSNLTQFSNMSTKAFDLAAYSLNSTQTGCYRPGALPVALAQNDTCLLGWYCPASSDSFPPQYCPPFEQCTVIRSTKGTCNVQGVLEPHICADGFYCQPGGKQQVVCPKGTFCPSGSYQPMKCSFGAICAQGSRRQIVTVPLGITVAIDIALAIVVLVGFAISKWRKSRPKQYTTLDQNDGGGDDIELLAAQSVVDKSASPRLSVSTPREDAIKPLRPSSTHTRRASGMVDNMDGAMDEDNLSQFDDLEAIEDDFHNSPDMQRFIRSMSKTIETNSIGLSFDFENLSFETRGGKKILQDITGTMPRGSCWGVMGGSGAGKSTFVNVLMGKMSATSGSIKINGWSKDMHKYKKLIGYVPQDDVLFPELTVRENILHSARIRLPASWRDKAIQDHVDSLIACLQLTHVQHSRVGDARAPVISGGQRKRVNIGMELAAAPMAIFLDEPTSGLDATSAATIMRLLKAISRLGVTTIAIIHQPREQIFYGFDQLLLLAQGRSVYSGATEDVQQYFEGLGFAFPQRSNPADTLIDIITGDGAQYTLGAGRRETDVRTLIDEWKSRGQYGMHFQRHLTVSLDGSQAKRNRRTSNQSINSTVEQEESLRRTMKARGATWPAQVFYCWKRAMTQQVRNATSFFFEIGVGGLAGVIIGLSAFAANGHLFQGVYHLPFTMLSSAVDYNSTPQIGLLGAMAIGLAASAPGFWVFGEEKMMYYRETASGHSRSAYYLGKLLSTLVRIALSSLHFTVFLGVLATPLISFPRMYAANLLYFWCIYGLASVVSMLVKREDGPLIAVLASLVIGVLGGVAPPLSKVKMWHVEWLWRMSPGVWFTESYVTENWTPMGYLYQTDLASKTIGFTLGQFGSDVGILFLIGCVYRVIAYLALIMVNRDKQR
ncbi:hypothetical protein LTR91_007309 [Friedmanniomyces endolithicus]|uniref:ABC transporter domain-containing protein n=1 Tax=Friedmanniomyces endolithicus TaxID=329885 RepID=A0AAN6QW00_9PEZI|nr:hypothetical protein LTR59_003918 [Friedmanniomyces endolithicus]KAK0809812.1 hypothetical protein LTR38_004142 [Friedmanniomyces endolithicus]KAK0820475.1 hypothetical protein LTR75_001638 [Friedmanniomyces endolithicus]KAK0848912.1 hypothetical protein LTR03_005477 [Friedmanniomyces endolithicus]KAK0881210.1 hypothetical protein LTR87_004942 [Friedmanniomyces endolithicus]